MLYLFVVISYKCGYYIVLVPRQLYQVVLKKYSVGIDFPLSLSKNRIHKQIQNTIHRMLSALIPV
jgi:hypothetical protein